MASTKGYRDYVLEQLVLVPDVSCRSMMREFLLYSEGVLFGGIYDDRLLIKKIPENEEFGMKEEIPYDGGKSMFLVEDMDDKIRLEEIINKTKGGLSGR